MAKFMFQGAYTHQGAAGLLKGGGAARRKALDILAESLDGQVEALYFGFGDRDAYVVADLPDNTAAARFSLAAGAAGVADVRTIVLLTPDELDNASKRKADYRPPGS